MRKVLLSLLGIVLLLTSCNNEDDFTGSLNQSQSANHLDRHFYGVKTPDENNTKGVAQKDKLWYNGTTIKIKFLNGNEDYQQKVKAYAVRWEQYANIKFDFVEDQSEKAQIRIGFDWNDQRYITWSYTGTDCKYERNQNEATMSFAYWDSSTEEEIKGDVLRAFGQALGLELEHRHLDFDAGWTNKIQEYWEGEIEDADWEDLREYVFDPLESTNVIQTQGYDENSIMIWPFSKKYARNTARDYNYELSETDIEFIKQLYPKPEIIENLIVNLGLKKTEGYQFIGFHSMVNEDIIVDWGNGIIDTIKSNPELQHIWKEFGYDPSTEPIPSEYSVKVYGSSKAIKSFELGLHIPTTGYIDISGSADLESLTTGLLKIKELDVSKNTKLKYLACNYSLLTSLDVSNCPELEILSCDNNLLTSLDLSNNKKLSMFYCSNNQLKSLDVSNNPELVSLSCDNNPLTSLNISNNRNLMKFYCHDCLLPSLDVSNNENLYRFICYNNPFITNYDEMMAIVSNLRPANQLPDWTHIDVQNETTKSWIQAICDSKGWHIN